MLRSGSGVTPLGNPRPPRYTHVSLRWLPLTRACSIPLHRITKSYKSHQILKTIIYNNTNFRVFLQWENVHKRDRPRCKQRTVPIFIQKLLFFLFCSLQSILFTLFFIILVRMICIKMYKIGTDLVFFYFLSS